MVMLFLKETTRFESPTDHSAVSRNLFRLSFWGASGSGATALVSFIFNRSQEGSWKTFASHVFKASLTSCVTFTAVAAYCFYNIKIISIMGGSENSLKTVNGRVSLFAKSSALVGWVGAAAAWASQFLTSKALVSSLAQHSSYPLLGLGTAGSILWIFNNRQIIKLAESRMSNALLSIDGKKNKVD